MAKVASLLPSKSPIRSLVARMRLLYWQDQLLRSYSKRGL
uniref:Uncharacterized protein n=1 Tax=Cucumis melo TaxID=3656 RepID=A0A9I9CQE2_CUCME